MRLVTWNCFRGDARARAGDVAELGADVLVLQECARPAAADPGAVEGLAGPFHLLAVWAKPAPTYVEAVWAALDAYGPWLRAAPAVVAGDFNSHPQWDRSARRNHSRLTERLRDEFGLVSAWHVAAAAAGGAPEPATHYHRWRADRGFHIDYCFVPVAWAAAPLAAHVPDWPVRARGSDHRPLVVQVGDGCAGLMAARPHGPSHATTIAPRKPAA